MKRKTVLQKKKSIKHMLFSIPMIIILLIFVFFLTRGVTRMVMRSHDALQKLAEERIELERAQERNGSLATDLHLLRTDFGKEQLIRQKYNVALPGEEYVRLVGREEKVRIIVEEDRSWFGGVFDSIGSWFGK